MKSEGIGLMDLAAAGREYPQFGKSVWNTGRSSSEVFGAGDSNCGCGGGCASEPDQSCSCGKTCASDETSEPDPEDPCGGEAMWPQDTENLCEDLLKCLREEEDIERAEGGESGSSRWLSKHRECLQIRARMRQNGVECPAGPDEKKPFKPEVAKKRCLPIQPLSPSAGRACDYGDDAITMNGCTWTLNCICRNAGNSPGLNCMRGCIACLRNQGNNYGEKGHEWCRKQCKWTGKEVDSFIRASRQCMSCPDPLMEAVAMQLARLYFAIFV